MVTMVIEATPQQVLAMTGIPFVIAFVLALVMLIGVERKKSATKLSTSILGTLTAVAFATSLVPWVILAEQFGPSRLLISTLWVAGVTVVALLLWIRHLVKKPARHIPIAGDTEMERQLKDDVDHRRVS